MVHRLRTLQEREQATREMVVEKFSELLTEMLPRTHLQVIEHGNPATMRVEVKLAYLPDKTEVGMSMMMVPEVPRATRHADLQFQPLDAPN